jgi:sulfate transport system substrate-binding protein
MPLAAAAAAATLVLAACGSDSPSGGGTGAGDAGGTVSLVAYSTPEVVYSQLIPAFGETAEGEGVEFSQSYGASGEQRRAVEAGLPASVVAFSLAPDVDRLVTAGIVAEGWDSGPTKGMVSDSVVAFIVRKGNPKGIRTWADLTKDGVEVLTPNVFTSGGAKWNTMAAYGAQIELGKTPAQARAYLQDLYGNVVVQDKSARESLQTFVGGKGDVLLGYENEAILAQKKGQDIDYVVPEQTLLIENPIAVTTDAPAAAQRFVDYALSPEGQTVFGQEGYRPVDPAVAAKFDYPTPSGLFTIADLGGWPTVNDEFFDRDTGVVAKIFQAQGTPIE